ncbi:MAG: DUF1553 domain-containing protein [Isosphaeraceae bacterium]
MVKVPTPADEARLRAIDAELADAKKQAEAAEAALPERIKSWEREVRSAGAEVPRRDWSIRFPLDGSLGVFGTDLETGKLDYREGKPPTWAEGPIGRALSLPGTAEAFAQGPAPAGFERTDRFSYGGWVRPRGNGAVLSKMDGQFRGFDAIVSGDKLEVHLVHAWPGDAVKVETRAGLPKGRWSHVLVTYDGSGKAAGVVVYVDGRPVPLDVKADSLKNSIQTPEPIRVGSRAGSSPFHGDLADLRVYARTLSAKEAEEVAADAAVSAARLEEDRRNEVQRALLAQHVREKVFTEGKAANERLAALKTRREEAEKSVPTVMVMEDLQKPRPTYVLKRGRYDAPDTSKTLDPDVPACLPPLPADAPRNRLGLARWLVSPANPLTPRVIVNRLWQQHFGAGLVKTAENFGIQSELPSHPELLDWLAAEFVRQGWDLKALHRLMVTSATYRQTSKAAAETHQRDPENRWLARGPRFRLPAEAVRDNALAVSGLLTWRLGGPSVKPYQPAGLWEELAGGAGEPPYVQEKGPNLYRRSLYIYRKRTVPHPVMANFDAPSREVCQVKRPRTNTPLQALELLNDVTYVEAARRLAERMIAEGGSNVSERITHGFRRATARGPSPAELQALTRGLERYRALYSADRAAAEAFVRTGESPVAKDADPAELAAYTAVAGVILNLDETITRE